MAIIGIVLGTSNSAAAVLRGGRPVIIPSAEGVSLGGKAFPSFVAITLDGVMLVGEPARRQAAANPEGTATAFKRKMGRREKTRLRDREFTPEQRSAFLLQKVRRDAEAFLGEKVEQAVVTVPAYFDDNQRSATRDACRIAGLEVKRLVNEPTAASLAYGLDRLAQELRIAVIDLGGGTLDVTVMEFGKGVFEVKATSGDTQLGGADMNARVFEHLADRFRELTGVELRGDRKAEARLLEAAEVAKIELSTRSPGPARHHLLHLRRAGHRHRRAVPGVRRPRPGRAGRVSRGHGPAGRGGWHRAPHPWTRVARSGGRSAGRSLRRRARRSRSALRARRRGSLAHRDDPRAGRGARSANRGADARRARRARRAARDAARRRASAPWEGLAAPRRRAAR